MGYLTMYYMPLNAIIVDDEDYSRKSLFFLIEGYCPQVKIKGIARSVMEARKLLAVERIDLVFLDISMPAENGFALLPDLQKSRTSVIFTTAYNQYAIQAIKASAVDYLLKPIDIHELQESVEKAVELRLHMPLYPDNEEIDITLNILQENYNEVRKIRKINLPHTTGFHVLNVNKIMYVHADSNYSVFYVEHGEKFVISKHLKEYEFILNDCGFCRIHKSTIINLVHLTNYSNKNGLIVTMSDNSEHMVSRRRSPAFMDTVKEIFLK